MTPPQKNKEAEDPYILGTRTIYQKNKECYCPYPVTIHRMGLDHVPDTSELIQCKDEAVNYVFTLLYECYERIKNNNDSDNNMVISQQMRYYSHLRELTNMLSVTKILPSKI